MAIPGLFIEYLVSGAIAFLWIYPAFRDTLSTANPSFLPVLLLALYLVGMTIDPIAWIMTRHLKRWIHRRVDLKHGIVQNTSPGEGTLRQARITLYAPELAKELGMRSSRDRIARGAIVNAVLATVLVLPWSIGIPLIALSVALWWGFEKLSYEYERCAEKLITEKLQSEATSHLSSTRS